MKLKSILAIALCAVGMSAFAEDPLGSKENPWLVGSPNAAGVEAWTNGMGRLDIDGTGAMTDFSASSPAPWADGFVTEAVVGSNVTVIGVNAFKSCPNLKTLVLNEQTPPTLGANNDFSKAKIFVPAGKAGAYRASEGWKAYKDAIKEMGSVEVDALSNTFALDLTVGDRIAKDTETLVVDPAWGNASEATVKLQNGWTRTYTCASNDLWNTTALEPGRHGLAFRAGETDVIYGAFFWKIGADWVVFDSSNITADVTFEAGKTYLVLGTNTADGATLTVQDGAKFFYDEGASAGFKAASVAELPKRYEIADGVDPGDESKIFQIVEKLRGSEDNPWDVGEGVTAYTNGTELVIVGEGTITDLSEIPAGVKDDVEKVTVAEATVKGAADDAFTGFDGFMVSLPDNWQGELPNAGGMWYGAEGVTLKGVPLAVKNVKVTQRYPWNGLVDVKFDLTGEGYVAVAVQVTTNGVMAVENPTVTGGTEFNLGSGKELQDCKITWDAKADFGDEEVHEKIKVKLSVSPVEAD